MDHPYNDHTSILHDRRVNTDLDGNYLRFESPLTEFSLWFSDEWTACKQSFRESSLPAWQSGWHS